MYKQEGTVMGDDESVTVKSQKGSLLEKFAYVCMADII